MSELVPVVVATITIMGFLLGLFKWQQAVNHQKHEDMEKIFQEHKLIFEQLKQKIEKNEVSVQSTRDEMHRDFVRHEQQKQRDQDLREMVSKIFDKVDLMAKDLNQLIGKNNGI